jgi:putative ABC transport system permease protein
MFDSDRWLEIFDTIRMSKLRTAATALAVAWGIFILVVLLGAGRGLQNGIEHNFQDDASNMLWVYSGKTSKPHAGYNKGRNVRFYNDDYVALLKDVEEVEYSSGRFYLGGEFTVKYGREVSSYDVRSTHPGHQFIERSIITAGRFINDADVRDRRKVAVIGRPVVDQLFKRREPLGEWIEIRGTPFRVVGVFRDDGWESENQKIYIPISTAQSVYGGGETIHQMMITLGDATVEDSERIAFQVRKLFAARHQFAVDDERAMRVRNSLKSYQRIVSLFSAINLFIWIVGIGTIVAGIIGVSNIMLISVRERTKEIGIRKALGATPATIVGQIVTESLVITSASGYLGLVAGLGVIEVVRRYVPPSDLFRNPEADLGVVVGATVVLIISGVLAGYFPARMAARINPVEALRAD